MALAPTLYEYYTGSGITAGLSVDQPHFTLNNQNFTLYSGAMHYFRIPKQHWRDRLRKLRATGANTVETYMPWNLHEPQNGTYDFGDGASDMQDFLDFQEYLRIAKEEDLFAIVRPGPYICAEWEWGGFPSWLLREKGIKTRSNDVKFMNYVERYFNLLLPLLALLQFTLGGPIIAFQVENEYAYTFLDVEIPYMERLVDIFRTNGIVELLVSSDGPVMGQLGTIPGVLYQTGNFGDNPQVNLDLLKQMQPNQPVTVMEFWTGWFDYLTHTHYARNDTEFRETVNTILSYPASFNMYMFHGGTNFGFLNGAGYGHALYEPLTTSYDYDAPLTEAGDYTNKYLIIKELIAFYSEIEFLTPEPPSLVPRIAYASTPIAGHLNFDDLIGFMDGLVSTSVVPMELLEINSGSGQSYGFTIYRKTNLNLAQNSVLLISEHVRDAVVVLVNGNRVSPTLTSAQDLLGFGYWKLLNSTLILNPDEALVNATLDLIVENWGRINTGLMIDFNNEYKGLVGTVYVNEQEVFDWIIYPLEFKKEWNLNLSGWRPQTDLIQNAPNLYRATFDVTELQDTFVDMQGWRKGVVVINGFVLGRHCFLGPQQALYLPSQLLQIGSNEIIIYEEFEAAENVNFSADPIYFTSP